METLSLNWFRRTLLISEVSYTKQLYEICQYIITDTFADDIFLFLIWEVFCKTRETSTSKRLKCFFLQDNENVIYFPFLPLSWKNSKSNFMTQLLHHIELYGLLIYCFFLDLIYKSHSPGFVFVSLFCLIVGRWF